MIESDIQWLFQWLQDFTNGVLSPFSFPFDPARRLYWGAIISALLCIVFFVWQRHGKFNLSLLKRYVGGRQYWWHPSARLDYQLWFLNAGIKVVFITPLLVAKLVVAVGVAAGLRDMFGGVLQGSNLNIQLPTPVVIALFSICLFVAEDFSRFLLHWCMHRVPCLWNIHKVHHTAEVLTPVTLYRSHPLELLLAAWRNLLVVGGVSGVFLFLFEGQISTWEVLGVDLLGMLFNLAAANLRHSHIRLSFGGFESIFISPRMHQVHHSRARHHYDKNFGSCLSIWDRLWRTYYQPADHEQCKFGVEGESSTRLIHHYLMPFRK
ncbi:sterol desaturase family protein [Litoribacillus peritrichatus]|uniref:Fatty acid hydroxylase domain-containing protein n=1 Tax=Litoribacillus peritrichatus TaxID=718191 RepID=A0ABP7NA27_9GAMM